MFTKLVRYALFMEADNKSRMSNYMYSVSNSVVKDYRTAMQIKGKDLTSPLGHAHYIKEQKCKQMERENRRPKIIYYNFSYPSFEDGTCSSFYQKFSSPPPSLASAPVPKFKQESRDRVSGSKPRVVCIVVILICSIGNMVRIIRLV